MKPYSLFLLLIIVLPSGLMRMGINLGPGIPDITADRVLIGLIWLLLLTTFRRELRDRMAGLSTAEGLFITFLGIGFVFTVLHSYSSDIIKALFRYVDYYLTPLSVYFFTRILVKDHCRLRALFPVMGVVIVYLLGGVVYELLTGQPIFTRVKSFYGTGEVRLGSFLASGWNYAVVTLTACSFSMYGLRFVHSRVVRMIYRVLFVGIFITVALTYVRAAYLAVGALWLMMLLFTRQYRRELILLVLVGGVLVYYKLPLILERFPGFVTRVQDVDAVHTTMFHREQIFRMQLYYWLQSPFIGHGLEIAREVGPIRSHNTFMTLLMGLGMIGALPFLLGILAIVGSSITMYRRLPPHHPGRQMIPYLWGAVLVYLIQANSVDLSLSPHVTSYFFLSLGLLAQVERYGTEETSTGRPSEVLLSDYPRAVRLARVGEL